MNINNSPGWKILNEHLRSYYDYKTVKAYFALFHLAKISKKELAAAIYIWQQTLNYTEV